MEESSSEMSSSYDPSSSLSGSTIDTMRPISPAGSPAGMNMSPMDKAPPAMDAMSPVAAPPAMDAMSPVAALPMASPVNAPPMPKESPAPLPMADAAPLADSAMKSPPEFVELTNDNLESPLDMELDTKAPELPDNQLEELPEITDSSMLPELETNTSIDDPKTMKLLSKLHELIGK